MQAMKKKIGLEIWKKKVNRSKKGWKEFEIYGWEAKQMYLQIMEIDGKREKREREREREWERDG